MAQQYLPQPDMATCLARSAAQCQALGCQNGTTYWWECRKLTDGTAAVTIDPTRPDFDSGHPRGPGLSAGERAALLARAEMSTKLPDILSAATFAERFTKAQRDTIAAYVASRPTLKTRWDALQAGDVDLQDGRVQTFLTTLRAASIIADADVDAAMRPQAVP